ncbi:hypothetical protein [Noviherbaspirillum massiliense]|uniref:hypothetical protein n=1 Tax=Noviherbaspirillum massiliense TaxID=1465823 RepID=UPI00030F6ABF|nr:hypothetical protein [Noviherbaspirillum massiliense]
MGYWANTTYINHGSVADVADVLTAMFAQEGMEPVPAPVQRSRALVEPMQYEPALKNDLWGLAIFPGAPSWTVIQTAPLELLAERATGAAKMRLAELCRRLSAPAFQLHIYDSSSTVLVEASEVGEIALSGFNMESAESDPLEWNGEQLSEQHLEACFRMHPFQQVIADAAFGDQRAHALAKRFGAQNAGFCDNLVSVDTLICHKPLAAASGMALYFRWKGASRQRYASLDSWDEYRVMATHGN